MLATHFFSPKGAAPRHLLLLGLIGSLIVGPWGCAALSKRPALTRKTFTLSAGEAATTAQRVPGTVLAVNNLQMSPAFQTLEFTYRVEENLYQSDYYNLFLASPSALVSASVRDYLSDNGPAQQVVLPGSLVNPTHFLDGSVRSLYGDYRTEGAPKAVIEVSAHVSSYSRGPASIIMDKTYAESVPLNGDSPEALVEGWSEGLRRILRSLSGDMAAALAQDQQAAQERQSAQDDPAAEE